MKRGRSKATTFRTYAGAHSRAVGRFGDGAAARCPDGDLRAILARGWKYFWGNRPKLQPPAVSTRVLLSC